MNKLKTISIKGKQYVTVSERVKDFNATYKNGRIVTEIVNQEENTITMVAKVTPDVANPERYFTGYAHEDKSNTQSMVNKTSHIENCETSAVGRALAMMGIGIVDGIASADEVLHATKKQDFTPSPEFIKPMGGEIPACSNCGGSMARSKFNNGWWCPNQKQEPKCKKSEPLFKKDLEGEEIPLLDENGNSVPF